MELEFIQQLSHFNIVKVPRYINNKIQECALSHLKLKDMGQLRDRMEGQMYYNKLRNNILTEYALENILFKSSFDWDKRMNKNYKRKAYSIEGFNINLMTISKHTFPKISLTQDNFYIIGVSDKDFKVYISGLATRELIKTSGVNIRNEIYELRAFNQLLPFSSQQELISHLQKTKIQ